MMNLIWTLLKKSIQGVVELITFLPIILVIATAMLSGSDVWYWAFFLIAYYIIGILLRTVLRKSSKILVGLIGIAVSWLLAYTVMGWNLPLWISWAFGILLVFRGVNFVDRRWREIFPLALPWVGMIIYFCLFIFFKNMETLKPYASGVAWGGLFHVIASLFIFNSRQLRDATLTKDGAEPVLPGGIIRHNRVLIIIIFCIIAIVANFNYLKDGTIWLFKTIANIVVEVIAFIGSLGTSTRHQGGGPMQPDMFEMLPEAEAREPGIFDYIYEIVAYVLGILATAAAIIALLVMLYKGIKKLVVFIREIISRYLQDREWAAQDGGYVDVKEKLTDLKGLTKDYTDRFREWLASLLEREPSWEDLTDIREKIRYLYRHFLIRCIELGYRPQKYMTPNEIKRDIEGWNKDRAKQAGLLIKLYNMARYGKEDNALIEPQELEELAREIRS